MRLYLLAGSLVAFAALAQAEPTSEPGCAPFGQALAGMATVFIAPQACCTGHMQCAQFLSTTVVVRPQRDHHT